MIRIFPNEYKHYLCIPRPLEIKTDNQGPKFSVVEEKKGAGIISLDPGVRTFMTGYNPVVKTLNGGKGTLIDYIAYAYIMIEFKAKGILFMVKKISVRDISSVDACSRSTRKFVILWMNVIENLQDGCAKTTM